MGKRRLWMALASLAVVGLLIGRSLIGRHPAPSTQTLRLANGMEVQLIADDCGDKVGLALLFAVGTNNDPPGHSGLMHVVQELLSKENGWTPTLNADHLALSIAVPREQALSAAEALASRLRSPALTDASLAAAKASVIADVAARSGLDPTRAAITFAAEAVLPSPGDGRRGGIASQVDSLDLAAVMAFWQAYLTASNARLTVVGALDPEKVRTSLEQSFGRLPAGTQPSARPPKDMTVTGTLVMGDAPAAVAVAVRAPAFKDRAFPAFLILAARLMRESPGTKEWTAIYDPIEEPQLLVITGTLKQGEPAEPGAARIRDAVGKVLERPLTNDDKTAVGDLFSLFLGHKTCSQDPRGAARRAQLTFDPAPLGLAIEMLTQAQMSEGAAFFAPNRTAAVIAGGAVH